LAQKQQQQQQQQQALPDVILTSRKKNATFPATVSHMFVDYVTVPLDDFNELLEIGMPLHDKVEGAKTT
jgi:CheY-like chemotaxis protein